MVHPDVVVRRREVGDELFGEARADRDAVRAEPGQEAVVVTATLAEAATVGSEGETGNDDDIELAWVDVAGHHSEIGAIDRGCEHVDAVLPAPIEPGLRRRLGRQPVEQHDPAIWARSVSDSGTIRAQIGE